MRAGAAPDRQDCVAGGELANAGGEPGSELEMVPALREPLQRGYSSRSFSFQNLPVEVRGTASIHS